MSDDIDKGIPQMMALGSMLGGMGGSRGGEPPAKPYKPTPTVMTGPNGGQYVEVNGKKHYVDPSQMQQQSQPGIFGQLFGGDQSQHQSPSLGQTPAGDQVYGPSPKQQKQATSAADPGIGIKDYVTGQDSRDRTGKMGGQIHQAITEQTGHWGSQDHNTAAEILRQHSMNDPLNGEAYSMYANSHRTLAKEKQRMGKSTSAKDMKETTDYKSGEAEDLFMGLFGSNDGTKPGVNVMDAGGNWHSGLGEARDASAKMGKSSTQEATDLLKAKYIKREGGPGNYKYTYAKEGGGGGGGSSPGISFEGGHVPVSREKIRSLGEHDVKASDAIKQHGFASEGAHPAVSASQDALKDHVNSYSSGWTAEQHKQAARAIQDHKHSEGNDYTNNEKYALQGLANHHSRMADDLNDRKVSHYKGKDIHGPSKEIVAQSKKLLAEGGEKYTENHGKLTEMINAQVKGTGGDSDFHHNAAHQLDWAGNHQQSPEARQAMAVLSRTHREHATAAEKKEKSAAKRAAKASNKATNPADPDVSSYDDLGYRKSTTGEAIDLLKASASDGEARSVIFAPHVNVIIAPGEVESEGIDAKDGDAAEKSSTQSAIDILKAATGEGSRGGNVVGHTQSGKPIYGPSQQRVADVRENVNMQKRTSKEKLEEHAARHVASEQKPKGNGFTPQDHADAAAHHTREAQNYDNSPKVRALHQEIANVHTAHGEGKPSPAKQRGEDRAAAAAKRKVSDDKRETKRVKDTVAHAPGGHEIKNTHHVYYPAMGSPELRSGPASKTKSQHPSIETEMGDHLTHEQHKDIADHHREQMQVSGSRAARERFMPTKMDHLRTMEQHKHAAELHETAAKEKGPKVSPNQTSFGFKSSTRDAIDLLKGMGDSFNSGMGTGQSMGSGLGTPGGGAAAAVAPAQRVVGAGLNKLTPGTSKAVTCKACEDGNCTDHDGEEVEKALKARALAIPFHLRQAHYDPEAVRRSATQQTSRMYTSLAEPVRDTMQAVSESERLRSQEAMVETKKCATHGTTFKSTRECPICMTSKSMTRTDPRNNLGVR